MQVFRIQVIAVWFIGRLSLGVRNITTHRYPLPIAVLFFRLFFENLLFSKLESTVEQLVLSFLHKSHTSADYYCILTAFHLVIPLKLGESFAH